MRLKNSTNNTKKDNKISNLRILCIMLVVFAHSIIIYKNGWDYYHTNNQSDFLNYLCQFIYSFHMPLFFSLSGYLVRFSYEKKTKLGSFVLRKTKRLIIPYLCVGLLYLMPIRYMAQYPGYINNSISYNAFFNILLGNDAGHLWFLPTLFLIFILHYLAIKFIRNEVILLFVSVILFACPFFLPGILGNVLSNFVWFHCGYMLNSSSRLLRNNALKYSSLIAFVMAAILYLFVPGLAVPKKGIQFIIALAAIVFFHISISNRRPGKALSLIEKNSFGAYLLHSPLLYLVFCFIPDIPPPVMILVNFCILGLTSFGVAAIVRKTRLKTLLGE